ncbi:MAG: MBL fold metallo-hydrolase [Ideonella sp.]
MTPAEHPPAERPPRASATVVLVRPGEGGAIEALLLRRAERGDHNSGAWVFPGGLTDRRDRDLDQLVDGVDDAQASRQLSLPAHGLDFYVAAVRECFEESGILLASTPLPEPDVLLHWRELLQRGECGMADFCEACGQRLALADVAYLSHWLTPVGRPKRFDTRFFVAVTPPDQVVVHDGSETVEHVWIRPADALARGEALKLLTPTLHTLRLLARHPTVESLMAWAHSAREIVQILPSLARTAKGPQPVIPEDPAYAEVLRLDPERSGKAWGDLLPGRAVRLSNRLIRVTANNGSMMTGPGTNTYLIATPSRDGADEWAVVDPGPPDPAHVDAVVAAAPGPIRWIFATHTHRDHSPATVMLRERTGATVHGRVADFPEWQDQTFVPDVALQGGERFVFGSGAAATSLSVIHTPGHASNHLCYLVEEEKTLLTGDHVMQSSTVVINPPDGDMTAYLLSLRSLIAGLDIEWIAPGHGFLMDRPVAAMQAIVEHRLRREAKVFDAVEQLGPANSETLLHRVYADVPQRLHAMALRSLTAHLQKLERDGRCRRAGDDWAIAA